MTTCKEIAQTKFINTIYCTSLVEYSVRLTITQPISDTSATCFPLEQSRGSCSSCPFGFLHLPPPTHTPAPSGGHTPSTVPFVYCYTFTTVPMAKALPYVSVSYNGGSLKRVQCMGTLCVGLMQLKFDTCTTSYTAVTFFIDKNVLKLTKPFIK